MNDNIYSLVTLNTLANPDIKWETTTMLDVGVDFSLSTSSTSRPTGTARRPRTF
ncbi:MAG: hypothetical protein ACLRMJ_00260 [Alistipes finegoldii]